MKLRLPSLPAFRRPALHRAPKTVTPAAAPGILRVPRMAALIAISVLVAGASLVSFAESYRGLYLWAHKHGLHGVWAACWPLQVDVFIAVGELALFVALADNWPKRSRISAWFVTLLGLAVSVAGNVGHVVTHTFDVRATAAVPPLAAAAALAVGLGVLKRVVTAHHAAALLAQPAEASMVPSDVFEAAKTSLRATIAAGNPLSRNQLMTKFALTRTDADRIRESVLPEANGHGPGTT